MSLADLVFTAGTLSSCFTGIGPTGVPNRHLFKRRMDDESGRIVVLQRPFTRRHQMRPSFGKLRTRCASMRRTSARESRFPFLSTPFYSIWDILLFQKALNLVSKDADFCIKAPTVLMPVWTLVTTGTVGQNV